MDAAKKGTMKLLISFFIEAWQVCKDVYAAAVYVWNGPELTPEQIKAWNERHAETPPDWWHKKTPTAPVPVRKIVETEWQRVVYDGDNYQVLEDYEND